MEQQLEKELSQIKLQAYEYVGRWYLTSVRLGVVERELDETSDGNQPKSRDTASTSGEWSIAI